MCRPTKLTPEIHDLIIKDISNGITFVDAAGVAGIDYATFNNWMKRGKAEQSGKYFKFFQACTQAQAQARKKFTLVISKAAADGDWRAALEYLKRHDPENWGDKSELDISGKLQSKSTVTIKGVNYRTVAADLAPGSIQDSDTPGEDQSSVDGSQVG